MGSYEHKTSSRHEIANATAKCVCELGTPFH